MRQSLPSGQDWAAQDVGRGGFGGGRMTVPTTGRELAHAKALGLVTTEKRYDYNSIDPRIIVIGFNCFACTSGEGRANGVGI